MVGEYDGSILIFADLTFRDGLGTTTRMAVWLKASTIDPVVLIENQGCLLFTWFAKQ